jgi:hypothetical protein
MATAVRQQPSSDTESPTRHPAAVSGAETRSAAPAAVAAIASIVPISLTMPVKICSGLP